jgi:hypothetical protein
LQRSPCLYLEQQQQQTLDTNNTHPTTQIASPYKNDISTPDRKRDRISFLTTAALKRKPQTERKRKTLNPKSSLLEQQSSCIDPSASEEHAIEEAATSFDNRISFPLPARSLFSAHEEVVAAFSAGQRRLEQRKSLQQRRASITEVQREREAHIEILKQHFGRRFLKKALTLIEENNKLLSFEKPVVEEENDLFSIEWNNTLSGSASSFLQYAEFSIATHSTPEDLESVAAF